LHINLKKGKLFNIYKENAINLSPERFYFLLSGMVYEEEGN